MIEISSSVLLYRCTIAITSRRTSMCAIPARRRSSPSGRLLWWRAVFAPRALGLVTEWAALHRAELMEDWSLAKAEAQLKPIAPLE